MILVSKYTAIRQLVNSYLSEQLSIYTNEKDISSAEKLEFKTHKSKEICKVLYTSGVIFYAAKAYGVSISEITNHFASHFRDCNENFMLTVVASGLIHLEVADKIVAHYLQSWVDQHNIFPLTSPPLSPSCFFIQYAHIRCCSLIRLALHQGLISFDQSLQIPWLDSQGKIRLNSLESRRLIANLVDVVDDLVCNDIRQNSYWYSKALNLSQALISFWRHTCIWSDVKNQNQLAQANIGLIIATQEILRLLLEEKLDSIACFEM
jgi:hypothetical protein